MLSSASDEALVVGWQSAVDGSPERSRALTALLERFEPRISRFCLAAVRDRHDAADCAQEVLVRIARGLGSFRADCAFATWVFSLARRVCATALERRRRRAHEITVPNDTLDATAARDAGGAAAENAESLALCDALFGRHLSREEMDALILHHVHGLSTREITARLELRNPSGARTVLSRARRKLRLRVGLARFEGLIVSRELRDASG